MNISSKQIRPHYLVAFFVLFFILHPAVAKAATLYLSPSSGSRVVGEQFTVGVYVSSVDQAINAASGIIFFPSDKVEVVSVSKSGSIFNFWIQDPSFSNGSGSINFEGVVLDPGYIGASGEIVSVTFRVKTPGVLPISFSSGSVLANDGQGTNILTGLGKADFSIESISETPTAAEATTPSRIAGSPAAPQISSPTHQNPDSWYASSTAMFNWPVDSDVRSVRVLVSSLPQADPNVLYTPPIATRTIEDLGDGIWYFHVQLRNAFGWGDIAHFRFQIDSQKPSTFRLLEIPRDDTTDPIVQFVVDAQDSTSGIDRYDIQIDTEESIAWHDDGTHTYNTPPIEPGDHTALVTVYDRAGNYIASSLKFTVDPLTPPEFIDYPHEWTRNEPVVLRGTSLYPDSTITVFLEAENGSMSQFNTKANTDGSFTIIFDDKLKSGIYKLNAIATDVRGAQSVPTDTVTILVRRPVLLEIGSLAITYLAVMVPLIALVVLLGVTVWYIWHRMKVRKERLEREIVDTQSYIREAFASLRRHYKKNIAELDSKKVPAVKKRVLNKCKDDISKVEKIVKKELNDLKKELGD